MSSRQTIPKQWLIIAEPSGRSVIAAAKRISRGSGILLLKPLQPRDERRLRELAQMRDLTVLCDESRAAARVHNIRELRAALLADTRLILLSPLYPTLTHPDWKPIPRMRAAALARLGGRQLVALGGMTKKRYATLSKLGFVGWAGISWWSDYARTRR